MRTKEQIQGERSSLSIPVALSWTAETGRQFTKKAVALAIGRYGAIVAVHHKLASNQSITIHCTGKPDVAAQVAGEIREQYEGYVYGLSFLDPDANPWSGKRPSLAETERSISRQLLECETCQIREMVYLDEIQSEVFEANRNLCRPCKRCSGWTIWKVAQHEDPLESPERAGTELEESPSPRTRNERKRFRVRFKRFRACIVRPGYLEEVVRVDDVTRDGFRFVSQKIYEKGAVIQVAIPYTPNAENIFVSAQVIRFRDLPPKYGIEYGVAYMDGPIDPPPDE